MFRQVEVRLRRAAEDDRLGTKVDDGALVLVPVDDERRLAGESLHQRDHDADGEAENRRAHEAAGDFAGLGEREEEGRRAQAAAD